MTSTHKFCCDDLFRFNNVNLDVLTETFDMSFYLQYLTKWSEFFLVQHDPNDTIMGYSMGKAEGVGEKWHGHVSVVTVAPEFRHLGLAGKLMDSLESVSVDLYNGYFVDLFVRVSNAPAIAMYEKRGYSVYRRVLEYYSSETDSEDALGTKSNGLRAVQFVTLEPDLWNNDNICVDLMWTYVDMRKALSRDVNKKSIIPLPHPVTRDQL